MVNASLPDLLKTLTPIQLDFVQARMFLPTDAAAAEKAGVRPETVCRWPNLDDVRLCINLAKQDGVTVAQEKLRRLAAEAVEVIGDEMRAKRGSSKRLDAACTVLDRLGIDVKQTIKQQSETNGTLRVVIEYVDGDTNG